jgi:ferric-dicitrate binding protein FerR (iron transport regulator)
VSQASQPTTDEFAVLVRDARPEMTIAQRLHGWHALHRRALIRERRLRTLQLLALIVGMEVGQSRALQPLGYSIRGSQIAEDGQFRVDASNPSLLRFSDGSTVRLNGGTHGRLMTVTHDGARVRLSDGEADVTVSQRPNSGWELDAGPYTIIAHGAVFWVRWRERDQLLELRMRSGVLGVEGPLANDGVTLREGQLLTIRRAEGEIVVRDSAAADTAALAAEPMPVP